MLSVLPCLGWLGYRNSRSVLGRVRSVTVSSSGKKWFVSILAVREAERPIPRVPAIGIDMGVARFSNAIRENHAVVRRGLAGVGHVTIRWGADKAKAE